MSDTTYYIAQELEQFSTPLGELHYLDSNPRRRKDVRLLEESFRRFGQRSPIVYRVEKHPKTKKTRKVVHVGNHRLQAVTNLGWTHVAAIDGSDLTAEEMLAYSLADNRSTDDSGYDDYALAGSLRALSDYGDESLLESAGYDAGFLDQLEYSASGGEGVLGLAPDDLTDSEDPVFEEIFAVTVVCDDGAHQKEVYEKLAAEGFDCRVVKA